MKKFMLLLLTVLFFTAAPAFCTWDQFQRDCKHTGQICDISVDLPLCIKWRFPVGGQDGALPLTDSDGNLYYNNSDHTQKISITQGRTVWTTYHGSGDSPGLLYKNTFILINQQNMVALDRDTGTVLWDKPVTGMTGVFGGDGGTFATQPFPCLKDNMIYCGTSQGEIVVVNADSGDTVKVTKFGTQGIFCSPSVDDDGTVYAGCNDNYMYAVDPVAGTVKWKTNCASPIQGSASVDSTGIYFPACNGRIYKLDKSNGSVIWTKLTESFSNGSGALYDDSYVCASDDRYVYRFDKQTGTIKWKIYCEDNFAKMSTVVICAKVYVAGCIDKLVRIDFESGTQEFVCNAMASNFSNLSYWNGNLIFKSEDGYMYVVGQCPAGCAACTCNAHLMTPTLTPNTLLTPTITPVLFVPTLTSTPTMTLTSSLTPTYTATTTSTPTLTVTPTSTPMPPTPTQVVCNGVTAPAFTVEFQYNPDATDNEIITITSSIALGSPPKVTVCPHGVKSSSAAVSAQCNKSCTVFTAEPVQGTTAVYRVLYPKSTGSGDIDSITAEGTDKCGVSGRSDGSFKKDIVSGQDVKIFKNVINPDQGERTSAHYKVYANDNINIQVVNRNGIVIKTIAVNEFRAAGEYDVYWDGTNNNGQKVSSGIYNLIIKTSFYEDAEKISVLR
jgi:outer membrane protein assembly factor BamB